MSSLVILGGVFAASFGIFVVVIYLAFYRNPAKERLEKISGKVEHKGPIFQKSYDLLTKIIKAFGLIGTPKEEDRLSRAQKALLSAGYRGANVPIMFYGSKAFLGILTLVIFWLALSYFFKLPFGNTLFFSVLAAAAGFYLPNLWVHSKAARRSEKSREGFPDALDLLVVCMEAGQGLDAALERVGREIEIDNEVLSQEFKLLNLEIRAGKSRKEALQNMALRTNLDDISSFAVLVNQAEELGTSIAQALRVHSDAMRTKRWQRAETIAARIPVKLTIPLILFILPCIFAVIIGPGCISALRNVMQAGFK
ncbi:MAG: type II secretion system F family protein [Desulfobacterales bacterium]